LEKTVLLGELALDGRVRPVRGVLPAMIAAKREGWPAVVVPVENRAEAALVDGIDVYGAGSLRQVQSWLDGAGELERSAGTDACEPDDGPELADVVGQQQARFAVELAAAGAHHLMLT
jgi:magnesium chelatase family protein